MMPSFSGPRIDQCSCPPVAVAGMRCPRSSGAWLSRSVRISTVAVAPGSSVRTPNEYSPPGYQRIPDTRITDILLEVDDATRFTEAFTHLRTGAPCRDRIGLLNLLLAEGINLGLRKIAEATTTHGFWELMSIARWHVEGEAYDRALSVVVEAQAALPMAAFWGTGRTASSDGQFFPAAGRGEALNLVNARYGTEPGLKAYSHVSDRFSPFATQTIPATVHEAPYILDGLLMNETGRRVREQYADTGGFTDHVFAACSILGYAVVPRIRDLPSKRLYVFERAGVPKQLRPLVGGKVNADLIDRNWTDILRVASTMAAGTMRPSQITWVAFSNVRLGRGERSVSGGVLFGGRLCIGN